jgi:hypothetical protein
MPVHDLLIFHEFINSLTTVGMDLPSPFGAKEFKDPS